MILRRAEFRDAELLYEWRRADEAEPWYEGERVDRDQHIGWVYDRVENPLVHMWIAEEDGVPIGQARIDSNDEISFSIDESWRGQGYGERLVRQATRSIRADRMKANVDAANEAGLRTLLAAGYVLRDDVRFLRWPR